MIVVALTEYLVVRLSVVGAEHHTHQRQVQFVSGTEALTADAEVVSGCGRWHDVECCPDLTWVVARCKIVDATETYVGCTAHLHAQMADGLQIVVSGPIQIIGGLKIGGVSTAILGFGEIYFVLDGSGPSAQRVGGGIIPYI